MVTATSQITMPRELTFTVDAGNIVGGTITVKGKETPAGVTYRGSKKGIVLRDESGNAITALDRAAIDAALANLGATLLGVPLNVGEVHDSAPYRYPAKKRDGSPHPQAGQVKAGTGGQRTNRASFVGNIAGQLSTAFVTLTHVFEDGQDKGFTLSAKVMPRAAGGSPAETEGFETL